MTEVGNGGGDHRVFFDGNAGSDLGYPLWFDKSARDLVSIGPALRPGLVITIYEPDEFEMKATLHWGDGPWGESKLWWAVPIPGTIKYLDCPDG